MDFDHTSGLITSSVTDGTIIAGGTTGLQIPSGTTAQRSGTPATGAMRINTTTGQFEYFLNSVWNNLGSGTVTSVSLSLPSIFSVTGSPITTAGTLTATLVSQAANTVLAGPVSGSGAPSFRTLQLSELSNVSTAAPATSNLLAFNGTQWAPAAVANSSASGVLSSWTSIGGSPARFTASFSHNLGSFNLVVTVYDTATNQVVIPDSIQLTSANAVLVTVSTNTRTLRIVCVVNGNTVNLNNGTPSSISVQSQGTPLFGSYTSLNFTGPNVSTVNSGSGVATVSIPAIVVNSGGAPSIQISTIINRGAPGVQGRLFISTDNNVWYRDIGTAWVPMTSGFIRSLSYVAASLDTPNSADWIVNVLAPAIPDPASNAITIRSFDQTVEQGVGALISVPDNASVVTFIFKSRAQNAVSAGISGTNVVQPRVYRRNIPNLGATGPWGSAVELNNISFPSNSTNWVYSSQTYTLAQLGWTTGNLTLIEITRRTVGVVGTNLAAPWLLAELTIHFR